MNSLGNEGASELRIALKYLINLKSLAKFYGRNKSFYCLEKLIIKQSSKYNSTKKFL
jgi:hypothetical protein